MRAEPPQVTYGPAYGPRTAWENLVLLEALQASQGQIGASVRGLAIEPGYELVILHACVSTDDAEDLEDLEELAGDMWRAMEQ